MSLSRKLQREREREQRQQQQYERAQRYQRTVQLTDAVIHEQRTRELINQLPPRMKRKILNVSDKELIKS